MSPNRPRSTHALRYNKGVVGGTRRTRRLPARPASVPAARRTLRVWLDEAGLAERTEAAELALSEVVTNALVHAGTPVDLVLRWDAERPGWLRVEVTDGSAHLPRPARLPQGAGTGRGIALLERTVDRWGAERTGAGKVVWFELGAAADGDAEPHAPAAPRPDPVLVVLLDVPRAVARGWAAHAGALLREHLLMSADPDGDPADGALALERHAAASGALALVDEHLDRDDHGVEDGPLELRVPRDLVAAFTCLDELLDEVLVRADRGLTLSAPTTAEERALRRWLTAQVAAQADGADPSPLERAPA